MREFISELHSDSKLFIADYDSYTIKKYKISSDNLLYVTKIGMLLFDHLLMPAAFFWQSEEMARLMLRLEEAFSCGVILPVIRDSESTRDIKDYYDKRVDESQRVLGMPVFAQPELATELAGKKNTRDVQELQKINTFVHLEGKSIRDIYAQKWLEDIENSVNINSIRLLIAQSNVPVDRAKELLYGLKEISSHPHFSRAYCINHIQQNMPSGRICTELEKRASWLYLKSNAEAYQSRFYYSKDPYNGMVFADNISLLAKTLSVFGLTREVIDALSINDILRIKNSLEYQKFIVSYYRMVDQTYAQQEKIVEDFQRRIKGELRSEKAINVFFNSLSYVQSVSATIFLALIANHFSGSVINAPFLLATGSVAVLSSILKRFDALNSYMARKTFVRFKEYIIGEEYRKQMLNRLEKIK